MLVHGERYFEALRQTLTEANQASVAVAFWGAGAERLFAGWRGGPLRIICNLAQGGTNPAAIAQLQQLPGAEVRQLPDLHAKLIVTDRQLVVGSANVSANGLGLEQGEVAGWREAGIVSRDAEHLRSARDWFASQWDQAGPVTADDLRVAAAAWAQRRHGRPLRQPGTSFMAQSADELRDRPVYFAVYCALASLRAKQKLDEVKQTAREAENTYGLPADLEVFEGWAPDDMPPEPDAAMIQVYRGPRGGITIYQPLRPVPGLQSSYVDDDGETVRLDFLVKLKTAGPWTLTKADRLQLKEEIRPWVEQLDLPDDEGRIIPAFAWRQWQAEQAARPAGA